MFVDERGVEGRFHLGRYTEHGVGVFRNALVSHKEEGLVLRDRPAGSPTELTTTKGGLALALYLLGLGLGV